MSRATLGYRGAVPSLLPLLLAPIALLACRETPPVQAPAPSSAQGAPGPAAEPAVLALITVDTWRFDHFSAQHSPNLWALAAQGVRLDNAWSPMGLTSPAHATMLSGLAPWEHGLRANNHHGYSLAEGIPWLPDQLDRPAAAFVSAYPAGPEGGLGRGFDHFSAPDSGERPGDVAVAQALAWLAGQERAFVWVHLYEPHGPYQGTGATDVERYAEEVALADAMLAPLLAALVQRGARVVVASDHGEVLVEETCGRQHERSSSPLVLHVPVFWWEPGLDPAVDTGLRSLADVAALLLGQPLPARSVVLAESGLCEASCAPGCTPPGLSGRDRVAIDAGGRWVDRPGRGLRAVGSPDPDHAALLQAIPPVPPALGAVPEEAAVLGYVDP